MRRIEVVEKIYDSFLFTIDKYVFQYSKFRIFPNSTRGIN